MHEYLPLLTKRGKWLKEEKSIKSEVNADQKAKHEAEKRERLAAAAKKREKMLK